MIIPIKVTTEYSLLKSLIKIPKLMDFLKSNNISVCGICDDELFGLMQFYLACKDNNIKPLLGIDIVIEENHFYLYAKNYLGYQKLLKINTKKFEGLSYEDILDDNIFILIPYESNDTYQNFKNKKNIYITYRNLSEKKNALLISENVLYVNNIRALNEEDYTYLHYLKDLGGVFTLREDDYYQNKKYDSDDLKRCEEFADLIDIEIPFNNRYIPKYKETIDSYEYLKKLSLAGLKKRCNGILDKVYLDRLDYELNTIKDMGFVDYFLIVYDYVLYAKKNNILVGPGRGSAAGSLVSYSIGITDIDPIKYNLLFARFLNPSRQKMPDIDIDFEDTKRDEIISYVKKRYGIENVACGITFNNYKSKLVLRDVSKILKIDDALFNKFIRNIDAFLTLKQNKENDNVKKYLKIYPELNNLYDVSMHLEGIAKNTSTHAAGVVISSIPLDEVIPIYKDNDEIKTGYAMEYLEKLGLLKMDFLALKNLSMLDKIISSIPNLNINDIPLDDQKTFDLFNNADTDYIFQFSSSYVKNALLKVKVNSFLDLSNIIALVRPGAASQIDEYIKNNPVYEIKELEPILKDNHGIIIYQEDVIKIFETIGDFTSFEADNIRSALSKKKESIIEEAKGKFVSNALKKGYSKELIEDLFLKLVKFGEYGFNRSHSVSYALISYKLAYLKANYPINFYTAMLDFYDTLEDRKKILNEIKKLGIKLLKPNINVSSNNFIYKNKYLLLPFRMVKNLNTNIIKEIMLRRNKGYSDIFDFFIKCNDLLNINIYKVLVLSGILDEFKYNKKTLIESYDVIKNYADLGDATFEKPLLNINCEYDDSFLQDMEQTYYGFYIGNHPTSIYKDVIKLKDYKKYAYKNNINMVLLVEKVTVIKTKKGDNMAFVEVSDETGTGEITLFSDVLKTLEDIKNKDVIFINAKVTQRFDKYQIIVNNIKRK